MDVKRYLLCHVKSGMILARPILLGGNRSFSLNENTIPNQKMINQLALQRTD